MKSTASAVGDKASPLYSPYGRRNFLKFSLAAPALTGLLASCGIKAIKPKPVNQRLVPDLSHDGTVHFSNWSLYIDINEHASSHQSKHPTLTKFTQETGIKVWYSEDINDNEEYFGKLRPLLSVGASPGTDLIVLSDWMAARMNRLGWVLPFRKENMPQLTAHFNTQLPPNSFDIHNDWSAPWVYGLIGIGVNKKAVGGQSVTSIHQLLTDPVLHGRVALLNEMESTIGLVMLDQGIDPQHFTDADFDNCLKIIKDATGRGQIKTFSGNDYPQSLQNGTYAACLGYSGDILQLNMADPDIYFVTPQAGALAYTDNLMIPAYCSHRTNAEKIIDFYYNPVNAAMLSNSIQYISPVAGAQQAMEHINPAQVENSHIFPPKNTINKMYQFKNLTSQQEYDYLNKFQSVIAL